MNSTNETELRIGYPFEAQIAQSILLFIVCLVGLIGNTLVIYVVIRFSKMQTVTNMYIVNLAIADECFLIGIPFLIVTILRGGWIFGHFACKAFMITTSINQFTSSILLCVMSADRYIAVCHPISSPRWRTPFISKIVSLFAWTFSIFLIIPIIKYAREVPHDGKASCLIDWEPLTNMTEEIMELEFNKTKNEVEIMSAAKIFTYYTFICSFAIPLGLILVFYWFVIMKLKTVGPKNKSKEKRRSHRKVTNLVLIVVTMYVFCWLPYWVTQLAINGNEVNTLYITLHVLVSCMSYSNSAINPILYAFLSDNFRKSFHKACTCATNNDINATLQLENSVFPKKSKHHSERNKTNKPRVTGGTSLCVTNEEDNDAGPLVLKGEASTSALTLTSRHTNIEGSRDNISKISSSKNGNAYTSEPTCL